MSQGVPIALVVDAQEFRRASLTNFLLGWAGENEIKLVSVAPDELLNALETGPDCRCAIYNLGGTSIKSSEVLQRLKVIRALATEAAVAVMSDLEDASEVKAALKAGTDGYLPSSMAPDLTLQALTFLLNGGSFFPPSAIREMNDDALPPENNQAEEAKTVKREAAPAPPPTHHTPDTNGEGGDADCGSAPRPNMTNRQQEVLELLTSGQPNKIIARRLGMTEATVKVHVRQIMNKLGVTNRTQAAVYAANHLQAECTSDEAEDTSVPLPREVLRGQVSNGAHG